MSLLLAFSRFRRKGVGVAYMPPPPVVKTASAAFVGTATLVAIPVVIAAPVQSSGIAAGRILGTAWRQRRERQQWPLLGGVSLEVPTPRRRPRTAKARPVVVKLASAAFAGKATLRAVPVVLSPADDEDMELVALLVALGLLED